MSSSTIFALSLRKVTHSMTEAITTFPNPSTPITIHNDIASRCYYPLEQLSREPPRVPRREFWTQVRTALPADID
jgi:hypothetical protein